MYFRNSERGENSWHVNKARKADNALSYCQNNLFECGQDFQAAWQRLPPPLFLWFKGHFKPQVSRRRVEIRRVTILPIWEELEGESCADNSSALRLISTRRYRWVERGGLSVQISGLKESRHFCPLVHSGACVRRVMEHEALWYLAGRLDLCALSPGGSGLFLTPYLNPSRAHSGSLNSGPSP